MADRKEYFDETRRPGWGRDRDNLYQGRDEQYGSYSGAGYGRNLEDDYTQGMGHENRNQEGGAYGANYGGGWRGQRNEGWGQRHRTHGDFEGGREYGYDDRYNISGSYGSDYARAQGGWNRDRDSDYESRYGGDTRNYGNANQGGIDRDWWERAKDKASSWFGGKEDRRTDYNEGGYRGKGPKDYTRSSDRIREDVCERLTDDGFIDASDIDVRVEKDEVVLSGVVHSKEEKRRAEDLVENIPGVRNVENHLKVERHSESRR